jgi:putative membrane protein
VEPDQPLDPDVVPNVAASRGHDDGTAPLEELVAETPLEAAAPMRSPLALGGTAVAGFAMGVAEVMPGFSGGTVALVAGIYERLVASIRQGARCLSLLIRGRPKDALHAALAIDWPFVAVLLVGMVTALFTLVSTLESLLAERPVELQAVFLGLVLGAGLVASRQLRAPSPWHVLIGVVSAAVFFVVLGFTPGEIAEPSELLFVLGGALAVSAWILPGVSGSFILLILGLYPAVITAGSDRDVVLLALFAIGCVLGLAAFSTLLNWVLARFHDLVLAVLIGLMVGSARVLWPWPSDAGVGSAELGAPEGATALLALALGLAAFALVYMFGLGASAVERRRIRRQAVNAGVDPH